MASCEPWCQTLRDRQYHLRRAECVLRVCLPLERSIVPPVEPELIPLLAAAIPFLATILAKRRQSKLTSELEAEERVETLKSVASEIDELDPETQIKDFDPTNSPPIADSPDLKSKRKKRDAAAWGSLLGAGFTAALVAVGVMQYMSQEEPAIGCATEINQTIKLATENPDFWRDMSEENPVEKQCGINRVAHQVMDAKKPPAQR